MSVTPETDRTVSITSECNPPAEGPTPKNEFKRPLQKNFFMSPTDVMVSPCTEKLMQSRRVPHKPWLNSSSRTKIVNGFNSSKLANKENAHKAPAAKKPSSNEETVPKEVE